KVVVTEAAIRDALRLDDAEGVDCLPNEEIFTELACIGYEKPSTKLTFYKAFFSSQWKLQALVDKKKVVVTEAAIRDALRLDDAEGVDCLPNEDIFTELACIGYEKPSIKLTFYKAFFSSQWKRLRKVGTSQRVDTSDDTIMEDVSNQGRMIDELDREVKDITGDAQVEGRQAYIYQIDMDRAVKVLSMQEDEPEVQEAVDVVTTAKLITEVVVAVSETVSAAAVVPTITVAPVKAVVPSTKRRRGVVIRDIGEESSAKTPTETKSKDKGKGIMDIDWEVAIDHVKQKAKENPYVHRLDYIKGMSYDDIRVIFEAKFNSNIEFLLKSKEQIKEEENRAIESINETPAQKVAKRRRLNKEAEDVEELKQQLEIVTDENDDIYTEATPLARKVPVVDYQIIHFNNKPHYKSIRADGTHQLYQLLAFNRCLTMDTSLTLPNLILSIWSFKHCSKSN
nr:hypothetical protein [Tanacetum cinerariifolium]